MITCKSCGEPVQANQASCQHCGMPVYSGNQREMEPHKDLRSQNELPTWLESLRVNERSDSATGDQSQFSISDLIDEGALPTWMRQEDAEMIEKGNTGKYPAWRPASMSAPQTDEGNIPPEGFPARLLIDEQSLPSWVHTTTGSMPAAPDSQKNFSAASLVQPDDLPDWMKSMPQSPQPPMPQSNVWGDVQTSAGQDHGNASISNPAYQNSQLPPQGIQNVSSGLHASSLLDPHSLPTWLSEGDQMQSHGSTQPGPASTGNSGLAGSSLIDTNAVPDWLRSFDNQQQTQMQSMGNVRPYGTAPRIENVPVPSRPRAEIIPQEQSELAANVFSSVLGVASSAPHFPSPETGSQWPVSGQGTLPPPQGFQNVQPQTSAGMQWNASSPPPGVTGGSQVQGYNPVVYQGGQQVVNPVGWNPNYPGMPQQPPAGPGMSMGTSTAQQSGTTEPHAKRAKRGFLDTIRSWFK